MKNFFGDDLEIARKPDFLIIGAMKCATSTLHDQLARQDGVFMTNLKEPNFFSDDDIYARGINWYSRLFDGAEAGEIKGESSTHYTKLPSYPRTVERIAAACDGVKMIYVMRHPVERLISHYIHEWTQGAVSCDVTSAVRKLPELVEYSCYNMQITPYLERFGYGSVLPVFTERIRLNPLMELQRIYRFLGLNGEAAVWHKDLHSNVSSQRMRVNPLRDLIVENSAVTFLRRKFVPKWVREKIRSLWTLREKPQLALEVLREVEARFDTDLMLLGKKLGFELNCKSFSETVTGSRDFSWKS